MLVTPRKGLIFIPDLARSFEVFVDSITVFLAGVCGLSRTLVDSVLQLGSGSLFEIVHLVDGASLVEASVELR